MCNNSNTNNARFLKLTIIAELPIKKHERPSSHVRTWTSWNKVLQITVCLCLKVFLTRTQWWWWFTLLFLCTPVHTVQTSVKEEVESGHYEADTESEDLTNIGTPSVINMSPFSSSEGGWGTSRPPPYFEPNTNDPHVPIGLPADASNQLPIYRTHINTSYNSHRTSIIKVRPFIPGTWNGLLVYYTPTHHTLWIICYVNIDLFHKRLHCYIVYEQIKMNL